MSALDDELPDGSIVVSRIEILRFIAPDHDADVLVYHANDNAGGDLALIEVLGMLRLTEDTAIRDAMGESCEEIVDEDVDD
jgi:hypothetical protein